MKKYTQYLRTIVPSLALAVTLVSCQTPAEEIVLPEKETAFLKSSSLGTYLQEMSLKDGSDDNVLDNASCLTVVLPVNGTLLGEPIAIETTEDISDLLNIYYLNPYQSSLFSLDFPLRVVISDHTEVAVSSQEELDLLAAGCVNNGFDDDIECIDFEYPVSIATYNPQNQVAKTTLIANDRGLYQFLDLLGADDILGIQFPITVITATGAMIVQGNTALESVFETEKDACDEADRLFYNTTLPLATEKLTLTLTDAPFPVDLVAEANVTIFKVEIKTGPANDTIPFITLLDEPTAFNLLDLTNGTTVLLSETLIPVGTYSSLNVYVTDGTILLKDGQVFELKIPSGDKSGIKIKTGDIEIVAGQPAEYLLDFDLSRSFVAKGNPNSPAGINGFNFKPVIRASNKATSGTLSGSTTEIGGGKLAGAEVSLFAADTLHSTALSNEAGDFAILGLTPGNYKVKAEMSGFDASSLKSLTIEKGKETIVAIELAKSN